MGKVKELEKTYRVKIIRNKEGIFIAYYNNVLVAQSTKISLLESQLKFLFA